MVNMASNIYSHRHPMGPALMAGAHTESGSSLTSDFYHFNHCGLEFTVVRFNSFAVNDP